MRQYQFDGNGYLIGELVSPDGSLGHNCTTAEPVGKEGHWPRWDGKKWQQAENHRGTKGYVNGVETEINDYGPLPDGWSDTPPPPTEAERREERINEIKDELDRLDKQIIRPMAEIAAGTAGDEDRGKFDALMERKEKLRDELKELKKKKTKK